MKTVQLGTYDDVKQRVSCSFCSLIFESIQDIAYRFGSRNADEFVQQNMFDTVWVDWRGYAFEASSGLPLRYTRGASPSLGRVVHPDPIATDVITALLGDCDALHTCSLSISEDDASRIPVLRVIDVNQMCIVSISPSVRYVALSYVWGGTPNLYLVRANEKELMRPCGLETYQKIIPSTIRDAIELVRRMNLEYLWVDALCLVQDDEEDVFAGINIMSTIYEHAYFTVIAANGSNADAGLPGVSPRKISQVTAEILPGIELVGTYEVRDSLEPMIYSQRAWTFQEFHFSRRKLIFANNMVYFICMEKSWSEDIEGVPIDSIDHNPMLKSTDANKAFSAYRILILNYCTRQATYQQDIVNGIISIYQKLLGRTYGGQLFGVPVVVFDSFMCFYTTDHHKKYLKRRESLPSWAWPGWSGDFHWSGSSDDNETLLWTANSTWIIWYMRDSAGSLRPIWDLAEGHGNSSTTSTDQIVTERVAAMKRFSTCSLTILPSRNIPYTFGRQYGLLQFWTFSASFSLYVDTVGEKHLDSMKFCDWKVAQEVFGRDEKYYGFIHVDEESSKFDHGTIELIVLSEADRIMSHDYSGFYNNRHENNLGKQENGCWYNVMYIEEGSGVAERKGMGQIYCETIQVSPDSQWKWKEIILG